MPNKNQPPKKPVIRKNPRKRIEFINFWDSGSGSLAEHGSRLAANRANRRAKNRGKFVSVDEKKTVLTNPHGKVMRQRHHTFIQGDAIEALRARKPQSIGVVNEHMFVDLLLYIRDCTRLVQQAGIWRQNLENFLGITSIDKQVFTKFLAKDYHMDPVGAYAHAAFRALRENGRLFITATMQNQSEIIEKLKMAGFQVMSTRKLTETEIQQGPSPTARRIIGLGKMPAHIEDYLWPVRISARKPRKGEKRDSKKI